MNPIWFIPVITLVLLAGIIGYRMGQPMPEAEAIRRVAAHYVREFGGALSDCVAVPATDRAYELAVTCIPRTGAGVTFQVNRRGGFVMVPIESENSI